MQWYHLALPTLAVIAAMLARRTPRSWLWVSAIMAAWIAPVAYLYAGQPDFLPWYPPQPGISFLCDGTVYCFVIHRHEERWERWGLGSIFMASATVDLIQCFGVMTGYPPPLAGHSYGLVLDALNVAALLLIGGIGIADRLKDGGRDFSGFYQRYLDRAVRAAHAKTHAPKPFRKVW